MFQLLGASKVRIGFYLRDAMLARVLVSYCLSVCVCLSEVGFLVKQLSESSWFLAWELPSMHLSYSVLKENSGIFKNNGTSLWNISSSSNLVVVY